MFAVAVTGRGPATSDVRHGFARLAERAAGEDHVAAEICHDLAALLERLGDLAAAEAFHRRAGLLLVGIPTGHAIDRDRIRWARNLAANLAAQQRSAEAADVLRAAIVLSECLLGVDDLETTETALALEALVDHV